eukprot:6489205-Amphidinium_carterae.1
MDKRNRTDSRYTWRRTERESLANCNNQCDQELPTSCVPKKSRNDTTWPNVAGNDEDGQE